MRGSGRDDHPVAAMWNALIAGVVFQHPSVEALLRELAHNPALLQACGFAVLPIQRKPVTSAKICASAKSFVILRGSRADAPQAALDAALRTDSPPEEPACPIEPHQGDRHGCAHRSFSVSQFLPVSC
ncbi:transposase [Thiocapsa sp.]|nr:transposase [Thiocapsa sp.]